MRPALSLLLVLALLLAIAPADAETFGVKKKRPRLSEFGNVTLDNQSTSNNQAPVVFPHWFHRSRYTCRVCHVDLGFAMRAGATGITEADIRAGFYCGACHNGRTAFAPVGTDPDGNEVKTCDPCHSVGRKVDFKHDFKTFRRSMPPERFGNGIDWIEAEEEGKVKLADYVEGFSVRHAELKTPKDLELAGKEAKMPDIIFSHRKHAIWNGCESCHPDIFPVRTGSVPYSMQEIFDGRWCGVCHDKVAFPNIDCQRCHSKPVY